MVFYYFPGIYYLGGLVSLLGVFLLWMGWRNLPKLQAWNQNRLEGEGDAIHAE